MRAWLRSSGPELTGSCHWAVQQLFHGCPRRKDGDELLTFGYTEGDGGRLFGCVVSHRYPIPYFVGWSSTLHERVPLLVTTNLKFADWTQVFGSEQLTAALLDRLTCRAHILEFIGESFRFRQRLAQEMETQ